MTVSHPRRLRDTKSRSVVVRRRLSFYFLVRLFFVSTATQPRILVVVLVYLLTYGCLSIVVPFFSCVAVVQCCLLCVAVKKKKSLDGMSNEEDGTNETPRLDPSSQTTEPVNWDKEEDSKDSAKSMIQHEQGDDDDNDKKNKKQTIHDAVHPEPLPNLTCLESDSLSETKETTTSGYSTKMSKIHTPKTTSNHLGTKERNSSDDSNTIEPSDGTMPHQEQSSPPSSRSKDTTNDSRPVSLADNKDTIVTDNGVSAPSASIATAFHDNESSTTTGLDAPPVLPAPTTLHPNPALRPGGRTTVVPGAFVYSPRQRHGERRPPLDYSLSSLWLGADCGGRGVAAAAGNQQSGKNNKTRRREGPFDPNHSMQEDHDDSWSSSHTKQEGDDHHLRISPPPLGWNTHNTQYTNGAGSETLDNDIYVVSATLVDEHSRPSRTRNTARTNNNTNNTPNDHATSIMVDDHYSLPLVDAWTLTNNESHQSTRSDPTTIRFRNMTTTTQQEEEEEAAVSTNVEQALNRQPKHSFGDAGICLLSKRVSRIGCSLVFVLSIIAVIVIVSVLLLGAVSDPTRSSSTTDETVGMATTQPGGPPTQSSVPPSTTGKPSIQPSFSVVPTTTPTTSSNPSLSPTRSVSAIELMLRSNHPQVFETEEKQQIFTYPNESAYWMKALRYVEATSTEMEEWRIVQRYALACIYYATNGVETPHYIEHYRNDENDTSVMEWEFPWADRAGTINECTWYGV